MKHLKSYSNFINEGTFYQDSLNPKFWQGDKFDPETRTKLLQIANDFYVDLKVDCPVLDVQLTGSLANYNWNEYSDLDVHVIMDLSKISDDLDMAKQAMDGLRLVWNQRHPVTINGHDVELYAQDISQLHQASGLYSLMKDEWIRKPQFNPPVIDERDVNRKVEAYGVEIAEMKKDLANATPDSARDILERASALKKKVSKARDEQLQHKNGEFSIENLVFKAMRNNGMFGDLIDIKAKAYSLMYSEPSDVHANDEPIAEAMVGMDKPILVLGPAIDGVRRLFVFYTEKVDELERHGHMVKMARLKNPLVIRKDEAGNLVAKNFVANPQNIKKYAGLSEPLVVLNSKTKTPFWHKTVQYPNHSQMLKDLSGLIQSIPDVSFS